MRLNLHLVILIVGIFSLVFGFSEAWSVVGGFIFILSFTPSFDGSEYKDLYKFNNRGL